MGERRDTVCMVCLSVRHRPTPPVDRRDLRPVAVCTIDQGVTCQARRSS